MFSTYATPKLGFTYVGRLPVDGPAEDSLSFFPESADDIAPEVAKALLLRIHPQSGRAPSLEPPRSQSSGAVEVDVGG